MLFVDSRSTALTVTATAAAAIAAAAPTPIATPTSPTPTQSHLLAFRLRASLGDSNCVACDTLDLPTFEFRG